MLFMSYFCCNSRKSLGWASFSTTARHNLCMRCLPNSANELTQRRAASFHLLPSSLRLAPSRPPGPSRLDCEAFHLTEFSGYPYPRLPHPSIHCASVDDRALRVNYEMFFRLSLPVVVLGRATSILIRPKPHAYAPRNRAGWHHMLQKPAEDKLAP